MKVLMFGWEFPPQISGGLGTACYGLTTALVAEKVDVIFVVPKLNGDEPDNGSALVSASQIKTSGKIRHESIDFETNSYRIVTESGITTIEIPSTLSVYNFAHIEQPLLNIQHWNNAYQVLETSHKHRETITSGSSDSFAFKGGYGPQLIEEVFRYANVAAEISATHDFNVIHAHDWMTYPAGIAAKRLSGKPLIVHVHATEFDRAGSSGSEMVYTIERQGLTEADCIVAVSNWTKRVLVKEYDIDPDKIVVVHNGVTPETQTEAVSQYLGSHVVTFLGRITYQKGPEYFVEAAEKVLRVFPDVHFIMAGSGDVLPQIIEKVARMRLSSCFHYTGFLKKKEINQVLASTSVYVMPSVSEPFGITPLEAIQREVPIIISNQSGVSEVMHHALKVDFWDTDALSQAICSVLKYESLSRELKKNAGRAINTITWEKAAKHLSNKYHELTNLCVN
jgi:glycosyltransferase involved in cell wall biosynthesis